MRISILENIKNNVFWNKLFRNMFSAAAGEAGSAILTVLTTIVMVKALGNTNYSTFVLAQSYMYIVDGIINFQSWAAVIKYGSERIAEEDNGGLESIIKLGTIVDLSTAALGTLVAVFIAPVAGRILGWSDELILCASYFSFEIIFHFSGTSVGVLRLFNQFKLVAIQKIVVALMKFAVILICFFAKLNDLRLYVTAYVISDIIGHVLLTIMSLRILRNSPGVSISRVIKAPIKKYNKVFWRFAFWSNLATSMDIPVKQFDVFILSTINYEMVAVYKIYKQIGNILVELSVPISQSIMPQFSDLVARGKTKDCYRVMQKLHKSIIVFMLPCTAIMTVFSPYLLDKFFGVMYGRYFYILTLYLVIRSYALSYAAVHQLVTSMGLVKEDFMITGLSNVVYLLMAFFLSKPLGIIGIVVALGTQIFLSVNIKKHMILDRINQAPAT